MAKGSSPNRKKMITGENLEFQNGGNKWMGRNELRQHPASLGEEPTL